MVSTSIKFDLNKHKLSRKSVSIRRNEAFDKKYVSTSEENWFTPNFKNCLHHQKKAPNKSTKSVLNRKSVSTSQNEGFLEKYDFTGLKSYFHSNYFLNKNKEDGVF